MSRADVPPAVRAACAEALSSLQGAMGALPDAALALSDHHPPMRSVHELPLHVKEHVVVVAANVPALAYFLATLASVSGAHGVVLDVVVLAPDASVVADSVVSPAMAGVPHTNMRIWAIAGSATSLADLQRCRPHLARCAMIVAAPRSSFSGEDLSHADRTVILSSRHLEAIVQGHGNPVRTHVLTEVTTESTIRFMEFQLPEGSEPPSGPEGIHLYPIVASGRVLSARMATPLLLSVYFSHKQMAAQAWRSLLHADAGTGNAHIKLLPVPPSVLHGRSLMRDAFMCVARGSLAGIVIGVYRNWATRSPSARTGRTPYVVCNLPPQAVLHAQDRLFVLFPCAGHAPSADDGGTEMKPGSGVGAGAAAGAAAGAGTAAPGGAAATATSANGADTRT